MEPIPLLSGWESFYVIVGSSAAGLTGLQFVVMTLMNESRAGTGRVVAAFATPTVVHFGAVVLVAAVLSAPWRVLLGPALIVGGCGAAGLIYGFVTHRRIGGQDRYTPVLEDWIWHSALPIVAYGVMAGSGVGFLRRPELSLYFVAAAALLLLFVGIHNAWDTVTYLATDPNAPGNAAANAAATDKGGDDPTGFV